MSEMICGHCGMALFIPHDHPIGYKSIIELERVQTYLTQTGITKSERATYHKITKLLGIWANAEFKRMEKEGFLL